MSRVYWERLPDFGEAEFRDGGPEPHIDFLRKLQLARSICRDLCYEKGYSDIPFAINSGSRSETKNQQVGGKPDSTHLYGRACDIEAESSRARFFIVKSLLLAGFTRIGIGDGFVHVDDGERLDEIEKDPDVLWLYTSSG